MSIPLTNAAKKVKLAVGRDGQVRKMHPSEKAVLRELADEAREADAGRTRIGARKLAELTGLSVRAVRYALAVLVTSGHISRAIEINGLPAVTTVHPVQLAGPAGPLFGEGELAADPPRPATATAPTEAPPAPELGDERTQIYAAWNAMAARAGLPGPVTPHAGRDAAVDKALAELKLWRVLAAVARIPDSDFLCGRNRKPEQGDWRATFDYVFKVETYGALANLKKLLEGNWHRGVAVPAEPPPPPPPIAEPATEPPGPDQAEFRMFRADLRRALGDRTFDNWVAALRWSRDGPNLVGWAQTPFLADFVATNFADRIRAVARATLGVSAPAGSVRIIHEREKVMA